MKDLIKIISRMLIKNKITLNISIPNCVNCKSDKDLYKMSLIIGESLLKQIKENNLDKDKLEIGINIAPIIKR